MILGIDPGSRYTGYAVLSKDGSYIDSGVIVLAKFKDFKSKLYNLSQQLDLIYSKYPIKMLSLEKIFLGKNADSAFKLGHARGVCLLSAGRHDVEVFEYAAKYVKKVITGSGNSDKLTVQTFVNKFFNLNLTKEDQSDALALAYCCLKRKDIQDNKLNQFRI